MKIINTGEELKAWRKELGLTQEGLAKWLGVSVDTIERNEKRMLIVSNLFRKIALKK